MSIREVQKYAARVTVFSKPLKKQKIDPKGNVVKVQWVRQVKHYKIRSFIAEEVEAYFLGKESRLHVKETTTLKTIYSKIKNVYDENGILIARRNYLGQPLRLTGKGSGKKIKLG